MHKRLIAATAMAAVAAALWAPSAQAAGAPAIEAGWAAGVAATSADLLGKVNPNGLATSARIEYLPAAAFEANLGAAPPRDGFAGATRSPLSGVSLGAGEAGVAFSRHIGFLAAGTAYRYRVVASNSAASVDGPARLFTSTEIAPVFSLPDNRGWELVSPVDKNGGEIQGPGELFGGGVLQAAAGGAAISYGARASFGEAAGSPGASQYVSRRGAGAWSTENISVATLAGAFGDEPDGVPFQLFSGDLSRALVTRAQRCPQGPCPRRLDRREAGPTFSSSPAAPDLRLAGASADLRQVVLSSCAALTADAVEVPAPGGGCDPAMTNLYRWSGGALALVNLLPAAIVGTPGATLAAPGGAVSADGSRIYFDLAANLYLRQSGATAQVDLAVGGGGRFEAASADGALAFFTKAGHLYRYEAATGAVTDLTPGGAVEGVLGASPDGAYLYFLTAAGLFLSHDGNTVEVAADADASNYPAATGSARVAANGNLAFLASAPLTEFDNSGLAEAYLYAPATASLVCASCNPTGARAIATASIPGARANGTGPTVTRAYKPRALAAAGTRLFFESADPLAAGDINAARDVYQWEAQGTGSCLAVGGCRSLISDGRAPGGASFVDASADGSDAYFLTAASLVAADPGLADLYDARVDGGFPAPIVPIACLGDACQPVPSAPDDPLPATLLPRAEGNPPFAVKKAKQGGKKKRQAAKKHGAKKGKQKPGARRKGGRR